MFLDMCSKVEMTIVTLWTEKVVYDCLAV